MTNNRHGLSRTIPEPIKRDIRQRSKFGCVICRCGIYDYEHIIPEFSDAKVHDPGKMCLLCGQCHNKVTRKVLSKESVFRHYKLIQAAENVENPWETFDLNSNSLTVKIGSCIFDHAQEIIKFGEKTILSINPPENSSSFPSISGIFTNECGKEIFSIKNNEWNGSAEYWDIESSGSELIIRSAPRKIALKLKVNPPNQIEVITLDIKIDGCHLSCKNGKLILGRITEGSEYYIGIEHLECSGSTTGIFIDEVKFKKPKLISFSAIGGRGIELVGTGIKVAVGAGRVVMRGITIEEATKENTIKTFMSLTQDLSISCEILPPRI